MSLDRRRITDRLAALHFRGALLLLHTLAGALVLVLVLKAWPLLAGTGLPAMLVASAWSPARGQFGLRPFVLGSLAVTGLAMLLAAPACLLAAIYLAEFAGRRTRAGMRLLIDLMAGVPSVVFGLFGVLAVVPAVAALERTLGRPASGYSVLAGGTVLAIMVAPYILSVAIDVLRAVPIEAREAAYALGTTSCEAVWHVVLRLARRGLAAALVLGFARAFGETIAVLMVVGNVPRAPHSLFDPAYPLPALIANTYGEMGSIPRYDSALMLVALVLMALVALFSVAARLVLRGLEWRRGGQAPPADPVGLQGGTS